jgi:hypothetical protein
MANRSNKSQKDNDVEKGAVEQNAPGDENNTSPLSAQLDHQYQDPLNKMSDSDFPEPGQNEEHSGEPQGRNQLRRDTGFGPQSGENPEGKLQDQDPGQRQRRNQNDRKDDDLAA